MTYREFSGDEEVARLRAENADLKRQLSELVAAQEKNNTLTFLNHTKKLSEEHSKVERLTSRVAELEEETFTERWENEVVTLKFNQKSSAEKSQKEMQALYDKGWQLCSVLLLADGYNLNDSHAQAQYYLKRRIPSTSERKVALSTP